MAAREQWGWVDSRTGKPVSITSTYSQEAADRQLDAWLRRDAKGGRPDLHEVMPHVRVIRISGGDE